MITILSVSDGHKHFSIPIDEYKKRTDKYLRHITLKPISHTNIEYIVVKETLAILEALKKLKWTIYLLDERGKALTTRAFAELIEDARNGSEDIIFIIGGSYWVDLELFAEIKPKIIKISDFVMPHGLASLVLIEQIYRAHEILKWSGYHHE
jgi:23S rRNA (pseudouridine1915-N3)-methyltransferase